MTREEAIQRLKEYAQYSYGIWHNDEEDTKAFDMAIEALSEPKGGDAKMSPQTIHMQQSPNDGADLISREEVLRMIIVAGECEPDLGYTHLYSVIESLPSAEVANLKQEFESDEAVQVVRCKDCKHYIVEGITTQYGWCHEYKHSVNEDDFCSYGEREEL